LFEEFVLEAGVKDKVVGRALFPPRDVLDEETVGVEPREEDVSNDALDTLCSKLEGLSSNDRGVAEVESAGICSKLMSNEHRIGVVLLALGHLASILSEHDAVDDEILERSTLLDGC
jgi:hypothetical protein